MNQDEEFVTVTIKEIFDYHHKVILNLGQENARLDQENKNILKRCNEIADRDGQAYGDLLKENAKLKEANRVLVDQAREYADWNHAPKLEEALEQYEKIMEEK